MSKQKPPCPAFEVGQPVEWWEQQRGEVGRLEKGVITNVVWQYIVETADGNTRLLTGSQIYRQVEKEGGE